MSTSHSRAQVPGRRGAGPVDVDPAATPSAKRGRVSALVGSGHKIALFALPFLIVGLVLSIIYPAAFSVGAPPALRLVSVVVLALGVVIWAWSVFLILTRVPRGELITTGPYAVVKHPLYTAVALLVLPWLGFLLDTWVGVVVGAATYIGSRMFATEEEAALSATYGRAWDDYSRAVWIPWL